MEPPTYEEATLYPPDLSTAAFNILPPPSYANSIHSTPTPPPTYGEAVPIPSDRFPILTVPRRHHESVIHPLTQVGATSSGCSRQTQSAVVTSQPAPVPISPTRLGDSPGLVSCPYCSNVVTSKVTYHAGKTAWCTCVLLAVTGLICGCCLIPFMVQKLQDVHHSCPHCNNRLHVHKKD